MARWTTLSESEIAEKSAANRASFSKVSNPKSWNPDKDSGVIESKQEAKPKKAARMREIDPYDCAPINLILPYPPTVNHYWLPNRNHSKRIGEKGLKFRAAVIHECRLLGINTILGRIMVVVRAYPPDKRKRDLDNIFKALLDAITHAGMIEDDGLIDVLKITRGEPTKGGQVLVTITALA